MMPPPQAPQAPTGPSNQSGGLQMTPPGQPMGPQGPQMPGAAPNPEQVGQPDGPSGPQPDQSQGMGIEDQIASYLDYALSQNNLAKKFRGKQDDDGNDILDAMGDSIMAGINADITSRQDWMDKNEQWLKLALLIREEKSFPWPKASNIKYPLIATAAMQFSARAYPALVPADGKIVKARVPGVDAQGIFQQKALRVAIHMSYQVSCTIPDWEENMDKLLMTMAISGICFKKTWHDDILKVHRSEIVYPENLIINYFATSLDQAYRKTEVLYYTPNQIYTKIMNDEEFLDPDEDEGSSKDDDDTEGTDYGSSTVDDSKPIKEAIAVDLTPPPTDESAPQKFYACHTYWDLDDDGYAEPYIVTLHAVTGKVVKIIARWDSDGIVQNKEGKTIYVKPVEYFTDFPFIPNPDGSIYACGFGMLMGPLNEGVNTLGNQLIDAGTLNNLSAGFIGKNLRVKMGNMKMGPGQWTVVNATGEDLHKSMFQIPTKEPSAILFQLMQFLVTSGNQLASIAEIFVGKMPGQNTPASTTQETVQQGMAVFTAIYKRIYRSLGKEFQKLFRLNRITPGMMEEEISYAGVPLSVSDYSNTEMMIIPGADPTGDSATVRQQKLQHVGQLLSLGTIDPMVYTMRTLEALELVNPQSYLRQPAPPAPDPKEQAVQAKMQSDQQSAALDQQGKMQDQKNKVELAGLRIQEKQADLEYKKQLNDLKLSSAEHGAKLDALMTALTTQHDAHRQSMETVMNALRMTQQQSHEQKLNDMELTAAKNMAAQKGTNGA